MLCSVGKCCNDFSSFTFVPLVPVIKKTWEKEALFLEYYSDHGDPSIPTINLGVPNTERGKNCCGHSGKKKKHTVRLWQLCTVSHSTNTEVHEQWNRLSFSNPRTLKWFFFLIDSLFFSFQNWFSSVLCITLFFTKW